MAFDLREFTDWVVADYEGFSALRRLSLRRGDEPGERLDLYDTADYICALATLGRLPDEADGHARLTRALASYQDPVSGHFVEGGSPSHVQLHATAYALAAMCLLDEQPDSPLTFAEDYKTPSDISTFIEALDWRDWVYLESHRGAGLGSIFWNAPGLGTDDWFDRFFSSIEGHLDAATGMFGDGKPAAGDLDQIGGTFHYAFIYESAGRTLPGAGERSRAILGLQRPDGLWDPANPYWLTLDAVYLLSRAASRDDTPDSRAATAVYRALEALWPATVTSGRMAAFGAPMGTHSVVAVLTCFAEAQRLLGPDVVITDGELANVLDRRPFI